MHIKYNEKNSQVIVNYYSEKHKGYMIHGFTIENAISFFKNVKKICDGDKEKDDIFIVSVLSDTKDKITLYKQDACQIRPILAEELNYITGKKERPSTKRIFSVDVKE